MLFLQDESRLWHEKYSIRTAMIPKFLALSWVKKILATGKSINYLHSVCHNSIPIPGKEAVKKSLQSETSPANLFSHPTDNKFHEILERCYKETSSLVRFGKGIHSITTAWSSLVVGDEQPYRPKQ